jgi:uncharacterized membrane protein YkgB
MAPVLKKFTESFAPVALSVVFVWFGILKIVDTNPTEPIVEGMLAMLLPWISVQTFNALFGLFEIAIGIFFLFKRTRLVALLLMIPHMSATLLPLFLLPSLTWWKFPIPSFEGQYIIKNIVFIALAFVVYTNLNNTSYSNERS